MVNPPFSKIIKTNVASEFLRLVDKHFPSTNKLHNIFNRNKVKVSYSTMPNTGSIIRSHNRRLLDKQEVSNEQKPHTCNCKEKTTCPLRGNCLTKSILYEATVTSSKCTEERVYLGITGGSFKDRFRNHVKSFNSKYKHETELSKFVWEQKVLGANVKIQVVH